MEQRQVHHDRVLLGDGQAEAALRHVADHLVGVHGALGEAGRARRVHQERERVGIHAAARCARAASLTARSALDQRGPRHRGRARLSLRGRPDAELGQPACRQPARHELAHHTQIVDRSRALGEDQRGAVGLIDDVGDVLGAQARVDGHEHRADLHHRERDLDPLRAVEQPERDLVARADAERDQPARHAIDAGRELGEGLSSSTEGERLASAPAAGRARRQHAKRGGALIHGGQHDSAPGEPTSIPLGGIEPFVNHGVWTLRAIRRGPSSAAGTSWRPSCSGSWCPASARPTPAIPARAFLWFVGAVGLGTLTVHALLTNQRPPLNLALPMTALLAYYLVEIVDAGRLTHRASDRHPPRIPGGSGSRWSRSSSSSSSRR